MGTTIDSRHSWLAFVAGLALIVMAAVLALTAMRPPPPLAADAPASMFSAERAFEHVQRLARAPRPVGSAAHRSVASYLLATMERLGLETEVQETTWVRSNGGRNVAVRVRNLLGRLPGAAGGDSLLLLAHYDSQPQTDGAGDDAAGVAVVLEAVRALSTGARPGNEILVAITDAEELGLFGAQALAAEHPWFERVDLVLNVEARGNRGLAMMFETAAGGLPWVRDLARLAPYPVADSLSYEVYQRMPNDTDFSMVREAGKEGLNFAFVDGHTAYHSALDTAQALDLATVQQQGANILSLVEHYAQQPIAATGAREGVYFNLGSIRRLWVYSAATARWLAGAALLLTALFLFRARRDGLVLRSVVAAVGWWLTAGALAAFVTWLGRDLLARWATIAVTPHGVPYRQGLVTLGLVGVGVAAWSICLALSRCTRVELLAGVTVLWTCLAAVTSWLLVGSSHLFTLPALALTVGMLVAELPPGRRLHRWLPLLPLLTVLPAIVLWTPMLKLLYVALTVHAATLLAVPATLAATLMTPALVTLSARALSRIALLCLVAGFGLVVWAELDSGSSAERPAADSLFLLQRAEDGAASWHSLDATADAWTARYLGSAPEREALPRVLDARRRSVLTAPAPQLADAEHARAVLESDRRANGGRTLSVRLSAAGAGVLRVYARAEVAIVRAAIDGRPLTVGDNGELSLVYYGPPSEGVLLEVEIGDRWPVTVELIGQHYGLPSTVAARPAERIATPGWWSDSTMLWSSHTL